MHHGRSSRQATWPPVPSTRAPRLGCSPSVRWAGTRACCCLPVAKHKHITLSTNVHRIVSARAVLHAVTQTGQHDSIAFSRTVLDAYGIASYHMLDIASKPVIGVCRGLHWLPTCRRFWRDGPCSPSNPRCEPVLRACRAPRYGGHAGVAASECSGCAACRAPNGRFPYTLDARPPAFVRAPMHVDPCVLNAGDGAGAHLPWWVPWGCLVDRVCATCEGVSWHPQLLRP